MAHGVCSRAPTSHWDVLREQIVVGERDGERLPTDLRLRRRAAGQAAAVAEEPALGPEAGDGPVEEADS